MIRNKKVLLRERKRHTAHRVVSTPSVVLTGYPPPVLTWQGTPQQGTPRQGTPWQGTPPSWTWQGTPPRCMPQSQVPPSQVRMGYQPGQVRKGYPSFGTEQQSEYLLHGGCYASCVHAGGLSCFKINLNKFLMYICHF